MQQSIGFVGAGRMAQALAQGIAGSNQFATCAVCYFDPSEEAAEKFALAYPNATRCKNLASVAKGSNTLVLAVKPQVMLGVLSELKPHVTNDHLVATVAAGIAIKTYQHELGVERVVRVMPNTPCLIGKGMSGVAVSDSASANDRKLVVDLMNAVGQVLVVEEAQLDALTGLSGSGPAYVFAFVEALMRGGQSCGLSIEQARQLAIQTIFGSVALLEKSKDKSPAELTAQVTSPGGTTLAGLMALEKGDFKKTVESAVVAARDRSIELSGA